jgi:GMP synthase (glutamine-hydrolysing)
LDRPWRDTPTDSPKEVQRRHDAARRVGWLAGYAGRVSVLVIEPEASDPVGPLGDWLTAAGVELDVIRPQEGNALPANLDGVAGLIVLGGSMGAADDADYPYLSGIRRLLSEAVAREVPTLGICLGAQLLALATGGKVGRNPDGPEYGAGLIAKRANAATDPLFGPIPITPDVIQWHVDAVLDLPPGGIQLASSPVCVNQVFRLGRLAWGIQFHIETTPALLRSWADEDAALMVDYDIDAILDRAAKVDPDAVEVWQPLAQRFAAIVLDPDDVRAPRPLRLSTADPITDPAEIKAALAAELQASRQAPDLPPPGAPSALPWPMVEPPNS